jgi:hypothetical protein
VLNFDRRQRYTFNKSFEQYVSTRGGPGRIARASIKTKRRAKARRFSCVPSMNDSLEVEVLYPA